MEKITVTPTTKEIAKLNDHILGDLTVDGQIHADGNITANGKIRSTNEAGIGATNPEDNDTSAYLGFSNNTARIRLRGDGLGADGPFQIQGRGDSVRLSVEEDGTVINGALDVDKNVTAPEFVGDLTGNATTASTLEIPRTINGVPFDGSESINITAQPGVHTHPISQVTNLQTELNSRSLTTHSHTPAQIGAAPETHNHAWNQISDRPSTFPPATHTHNWDSITGRPTTFAPSPHNHPIAQIANLQATLDSKWSSDDLIITHYRVIHNTRQVAGVVMYPTPFPTTPMITYQMTGLPLIINAPTLSFNASRPDFMQYLFHGGDLLEWGIEMDIAITFTMIWIRGQQVTPRSEQLADPLMFDYVNDQETLNKLYIPEKRINDFEKLTVDQEITTLKDRLNTLERMITKDAN